jgi:major membrane immunogen (membrane-anchored lipoprotein)
VPKVAIGRAKFEFKIKYDNKIIGTLQISQGGVQWVRADYTYSRGQIKWTDFADYMEKYHDK